jgi:hypothetical protein
MERKIIISKQPKCKTCGKLMLEWNAWADEHEHVECIAERISTSLIEIVKKQMEDVIFK